MKVKSIFVLGMFLSCGLYLWAQQAIPAFPSAEGYGKFAAGGRGGQVVFVENLEDYIAFNNMEQPIPGSFRWALTQFPGEPLTVIFRVSGTIQLKPFIVSGRNQNDIRSSRARLTIAGQTAPGEGITIRNSKVNLNGSTDLIVRNVRFRIGENASDSTFIPGGSVGCENALRVIFDHCVFGWSGEENLTMYDNRFTTVQWSLIHEGLFDDGHGKGNRSYAGQFGGVNATYHHNLLAHNQSRSPRLNGARTNTEVRVFIDFINNVIYNWGSTEAAYGGDVSTGTLRSHTANLVGNYYKPGPATSSTHRFFTNYIVNNTNLPRWHVSGNVMEDSPTLTADNWLGFATRWSGTAGTTLPTRAQLASDTLLFPPSAILFNGAWIEYQPYRLNIKTAQQAYNDVLQFAGTIQRDSVERRIIRETRTGTAAFVASLGRPGIIDKSYNAEGFREYRAATAPDDSDRDGMPDHWEITHGLNPNDATDRNRVTSSGYTALEVYLNSLMGEIIPLEFPSSTTQPSVEKIHVYPTLVSHLLHVESQVPIQEIRVHSTCGILVQHERLNHQSTVNLMHLSEGIYVVSLKTQTGKERHFRIMKR